MGPGGEVGDGGELSRSSRSLSSAEVEVDTLHWEGLEVESRYSISWGQAGEIVEHWSMWLVDSFYTDWLICCTEIGGYVCKEIGWFVVQR